MAVSWSTGYKNKSLDRSFNSGTAANFDSGKLQIFTGSAPGPDAAPTGTKLVEITLPADAFGAAAAGVVAKAGTWQVNAIATGTAAYFRIVKSGDLGTNNTTDERVEGSCGAGSGDLNLQNTSIATGQQVTVNTATVTQN
jgi:hypothetical protein